MKRSMFQKVLFMLLVSALFLMGCSNKKSTDSDGVLTITIAKQLDENAGRYDRGDDISNNPMVRLAAEKLGIRMETILLGGDAGNYDTKLRLALTGTEQLPDVFPVYGTQMIADLIESGRVKAIDADIERYMPARLKEIYKNYPQSFFPVTKNGVTYGIANTPVLEDTQVMIIRQDWLDKLGLRAPTNMQEFEEVIRAFTENDPDGNGIRDTYGFTYQGNGIYNAGWVADPVMLFSANSGTMIPGSWQLDANGSLAYGSIDPGNKRTLQKMAEWHRNGWIYPEAAASGAWDAMTRFTEGKAGIFMGRPWAIGSVWDVTVNVPGAAIRAYPTIRQDNGNPTYQSANTNDGWIMFNKDFNNMEAFFKYYDWLYDVAFGTGEFQYGYIKGYDYDIVNGQAVFDSELFNPPKPRDTSFMPDKSIVTKNRPHIDRMKRFYDMQSGMEPKTGGEFQALAMLNSAIDRDQAEGYVIAYLHQGEQLPNMFNGAPTRTMTRVWDQLQTMESQIYTNIIYGNEPIEAFDQFVQDWMNRGGEAITTEVNEWYRSVRN